jgi:hypothetical protein
MNIHLQDVDIEKMVPAVYHKSVTKFQPHLTRKCSTQRCNVHTSGSGSWPHSWRQCERRIANPQWQTLRRLAHRSDAWPPWSAASTVHVMRPLEALPPFVRSRHALLPWSGAWSRCVPSPPPAVYTTQQEARHCASTRVVELWRAMKHEEHEQRLHRK